MAKVTRIDNASPALPSRLRVAAYARVSVDTELLAGKLFYQEGGRKLQNALISVDQAWYISCTFS